MGNILSLAKLKRKNLHMQLTCRAENNNLTTPIISSIVLDMNCEFCQPTLISLSLQGKGDEGWRDARTS